MRDWSPSSPKVHVTAEQLREMHHDRRMSQREMAAQLGCGQSQVQRLMKKHGIEALPMHRPERNAKIAAKRKDQFTPMQAKWSGRSCLKVTVDGKRVQAHRAMAETILGRKLTADETVHHCDNDQKNNSPDNLWVFPTKADHTRYHRTGEVAIGTMPLGEFVMRGPQPVSTNKVA
jgi:hypothetical protein